VQKVEQLFVQVFLAAQGTFARAENLVFELFQFGRDVALGGLERLPAHVLDRCL
jgi:hypothetical protein